MLLVYVTVTKKVYMQPPFLLQETTELDYRQGVLFEETMNNFAEYFISTTENLTPESTERRVEKSKVV